MPKYKKKKRKNILRLNKKRYKALMSLIIVCVVILFPNISNYVMQLPGLDIFYSETDITLINVIDGDTAEFRIKGKKETVRFLLIDTPETVKINTPVQPYGKEASNRTKYLLQNAKNIRLEYDDQNKRDKYNRLLAYVFIDDQLLEQILVEEGLARVAYFQGKEKYLSILQAKELIARQKKIGIWSKEGYVTKNGFKDK